MGLFNKKTIKDIDLVGKRVLMRADYNVPISNGKISDDYRIKASIPTIKYILAQPGASLVILSHLGRPKSPADKDYSLAPVAKHLSELLGKPVNFALDCIGVEAQKEAANLKAGSVLLLENVRFHPEEEKNDATFAKAIVEATEAAVFVQDGFGVVHRAHATTDSIARLLPAVAGLLIEKEIDTITQVMRSPARPLVAVIGGLKIHDKIDIFNRLLELADCVAVGGAMANDFLQAEGLNVGKSVDDPEALDMARDVLQRARSIEKLRPFTFLLPVDVVVSTSLDGTAPTRLVDIASHSLADIESYPKMPPHEAYTVAATEMIGDVGPVSAAYMAGAIRLAKTVIWNGTLGVTETRGIAGAHNPFAHGTRLVVDAMIGLSNKHPNKPFTVVGGGDTVGYVESQGLVDDFSHVSTGGGATLDLLSDRRLPGVEVLANKEGRE